MYDNRCFPPLETLPRVSAKELCDDLDKYLEIVDKENTAYVITDDNGKDDVVLCPARWFDDIKELENKLKESESK